MIEGLGWVVACQRHGSPLCGGDTVTFSEDLHKEKGVSYITTWKKGKYVFEVPWGGLRGVLSSLECGQEIKKNFREKVDTEVSLDGWVPTCQGDSLVGSGQSVQWAEVWNARRGWEPGRAHVLEGLINHEEKFGLYPEDRGQTLEGFKQDGDRICCENKEGHFPHDVENEWKGQDWRQGESLGGWGVIRVREEGVLSHGRVHDDRG